MEKSMNLPKKLAAALLALAVAGCSSGNAELGSSKILLNTIKEKRAEKKAEKAGGAKQAPAKITYAAVSSQATSVIVVGLTQNSSQSFLAQASRNGPNQTYLAKDSFSLTFRSGILHATRGLGVDLMAQHLSIPESALFRGASLKSYQRSQRHLDGEFHETTLTYDCSLESVGAEPVQVLDRVFQTRKYEEVCKNNSRGFKNTYWVDGSGLVRQSQQSISAEAGYAIVQLIK